MNNPWPSIYDLTRRVEALERILNPVEPPYSIPSDAKFETLKAKQSPESAPNDKCPDCGTTGAHFCVGKNHGVNNSSYRLNPCKPEPAKKLASILEKTNTSDHYFSPCELLAKAAVNEVERVIDETEKDWAHKDQETFIVKLKQNLRGLL